MKVYEIKGLLKVYDETIDHQELLNTLYNELRLKGIGFSGTTKEITYDNTRNDEHKLGEQVHNRTGIMHDEKGNEITGNIVYARKAIYED